MRALVEGNPEPEFIGPELVAALHLKHVRTHEENSVTVPSVGRQKHELILPENSSRQEAENGTHLDRHYPFGNT